MTMNKLFNLIKKQYRKEPTATIFSALIITFGVLNFVKPSSTEGFLEYVGMSAINLIILSVAIFALWFIFIRKKKGGR